MLERQGFDRVIEYAPPYFAIPPVGYGGSERVIAGIVDSFTRNASALSFKTELWAAGDSYAHTDEEDRPEIVATAEKSLGFEKPFEANAQIQHDLHSIRRAMREDFTAAAHFHTEDVHFSVFGQDRELASRTLTTVHNPVKPWYGDYREMPLVAISDAQKNLLGLDDDFDFVRVVHNGICPDLFIPNYDVAPDAPLSFLGRFSPDKNPGDAVRIALEACVPVRLAGTIDPQNPECLAEIERYQADHGAARVAFVGAVSDTCDPALGQSSKNHLLGQSRAMLFPIQWQEPFGLVVIEANACGTPVIAYDHPGSAVNELIIDGVNGFKVKTLEEAAEAVKRLQHIDRRGVRRHFERNFTSDVMAERYARIFTEDLPAYHRFRQKRNSVPAGFH
jgi:glycosyltransferase involved in cell wall biosynthesis